MEERHGDKAADELEIIQMIGIYERGRIDLQAEVNRCLH